MLRKLLPVVLSVLAFLGGAVGGDMLKGDAGAEAAAQDGAPPDDHAAPGHGDPDTSGPDTAGGGDAAHGGASSPAATAAGHGAQEEAGHGSGGGHGEAAEPTGTAFFKFPQQFFVPIIHGGHLDSTIILTLSLEVPAASLETAYAHEIKLRDALLRQLMIHANTGGFDGNFTSELHLRKLRAALAETVQGILPGITGVLIGDIARQER